MKRINCVMVILAGAVGLAAQPERAEQDSSAVPKRPVSAKLANAAEARQRLGLVPEYEPVRGVEKLKIAVLDYGFDGIDGVRRYLPESAVIVEHYDADFIRRFNLGDPEFRKPFAPGNRHGRAMAQIIWAVTGSRSQGPKFYLLNANGPTMLRRATRYAIEAGVDIILFSGVFEGGGNGDGRGPVNRIVADALAAGMIWINAAGNHGQRVYNGPVQIDPDGYLRFRAGQDGTSLRFRNRADENTVTVTLTWNDYRDKEDAGTNKDLDLYVEDWNGRTLGTSAQKQIAGQQEAGPEESRNPRERIVLEDLSRSPDADYRIRIRARKNNFSEKDQIRVLVTAERDSYVNPKTDRPEDAMTFTDANGKAEIYPPADHPLVLTVGDTSESSSRGPTLDHRVKPDVILSDSRAYFSDGEASSGASNAAAYFTGIVAVLKAAEPELNPQHLFRLARQKTATEDAPRQAAATRRPVVSLNPSGRGLTIQGQRFRFSGDLASRSLSLSPRNQSSALDRPSSSRATSDKRVWQTPTRAELKKTIASERSQKKLATSE